MFDENEVRRALNVIHPNGYLFEIRIMSDRKISWSGYFRNAEVAIKAIKDSIRNYDGLTFYMTLNSIKDEIWNRKQKDKLIEYPKETTSDNDIVSYEWLFIDIDPVRSSGISSTNEQVSEAKKLMSMIFKQLKAEGFHEPIVAFSGNGWHLLYKIHLPSTAENKRLIENVLKYLDIIYSQPGSKVDTGVFNPARICKLYGTKAQKGTNTEECPHRMSKIWYVPEEGIIPTEKAYLEKLAAKLPEPPKATKHNGYRPSEFDLGNWLTEHGINYSMSQTGDTTRYVLDHCFFNDNHKGKDAMLFQSSNGAIGYHCFHASCADKRWQDVRVLFEPDAYEQRVKEQEIMIRPKARAEPPTAIIPQKDIPLFYHPMEILEMPQEEEVFLKTGIKMVDAKMRGLKLGSLSLISGLRGAAKSTLLNGIALESCQNKIKVGIYSGELTAKNLMRWIILQAAGRSHVEKTQYENWYNVPRNIQEKITDWLNPYLVIYNNQYGNDYKSIINEFEKIVVKDKIQLLILDNLMAFNLRGLSMDKYEAQTKFVWNLHELSQKYGIHIIFVAHPRKANGFLRLDDVSGTADLANAVDNAFIIHRVNKDFKRMYTEMFSSADTDDLFNASNVIEIAKDRDTGYQDVFVPLYFEVETKRLKNSEAETKHYGWEEAKQADKNTEQSPADKEKESFDDFLNTDDWVSADSIPDSALPFS